MNHARFLNYEYNYVASLSVHVLVDTIAGCRATAIASIFLLWFWSPIRLCKFRHAYRDKRKHLWLGCSNCAFNLWRHARALWKFQFAEFRMLWTLEYLNLRASTALLTLGDLHFESRYFRCPNYPYLALAMCCPMLVFLHLMKYRMHNPIFYDHLLALSMLQYQLKMTNVRKNSNKHSLHRKLHLSRKSIRFTYQMDPHTAFHHVALNRLHHTDYDGCCSGQYCWFDFWLCSHPNDATNHSK